MSQRPSYITGASARVKFDDINVAYAANVSYRASTQTVPIEVMGRYEAVSHEPILYVAEGTLDVVRYTKQAAGVFGNSTAAAENGNDLGQWNQRANGTEEKRAFDHFDPASMLMSHTFDLEVFQKTAGHTIATDGDGNQKVEVSQELTNVAKLINCRFTRLAGAVDKRGVLVERLAFSAILLDVDTQTEEDANVARTDVVANDFE